MLWWNIAFPQQDSKFESITYKFTKSRTPSQVFFKEFHHRCRTAILKNASWWLLLRTNLFWKHSCKVASQRQLQTYIHFRHSSKYYISYFDVMLKRNEFLWFFWSKDIGLKCKHTELALNFVQKQYLS